MESAVLAVKSRQDVGKGAARTLRRAGNIPAIAYSKGAEPMLLDVNSAELLEGMSTNNKNTLLKLQFEGGDSHDAMLKEMQRHPVTRRPMHADFILVDITVPIPVEVKLVYSGRPIGTQRGGVVETHVFSLKLECLPTDIPKNIQINIDHLDANETMTIADLKLPENLKPLHPLETVLVAVPAVVVEVVAKEVKADKKKKK